MQGVITNTLRIFPCQRLISGSLRDKPAFCKAVPQEMSPADAWVEVLLGFHHQCINRGFYNRPRHGRVAPIETHEEAIPAYRPSACSENDSELMVCRKCYPL